MSVDPRELGLPTRESEAREWIEAAVMLLTKDGVDVVLTGRLMGSTRPDWHGVDNVAGPVRVAGDLDGLRWTAEQSFEVAAVRGVEITGAEVRTPEGMLFARSRLDRQVFPSRGIYHLKLEIDFYNFPLTG